MSISDVAEDGFGAGAEEYERGRPSYPDDAVAWLAEQLDIRSGRVVVDLAAGTGKLTRLLVPFGAELLAVEPVEAMRAHLATTAPGVTVLDGTAEALPLPDRSVDVVVVAQAFHWFDHQAAVDEIARVTRDDGGFAVIWNERDGREPWVAELTKLIRWDRRAEYRVPYTLEVDWGQTLDGLDGPFGAFERYDTTYRQAMTPDLLVDRVLSTSYLAPLPAAERDQIATDVRALVEPLGDRFDLPYVTTGWAARRP